MPGFVKLTDAASGETFYKAIDLINSFRDAATEKSPSSPGGARTAIYAGPYKNHLSHTSPAHWVEETPETVQALIATELRRIFGQDGPSGPQAP